MELKYSEDHRSLLVEVEPGDGLAIYQASISAWNPPNEAAGGYAEWAVPAGAPPRIKFMYGVVHMDGSGEVNPPIESLSDLYDELFSSGIIDGDVSIINDDTGWGMSAHRDGRLVFEHLGGQGEPRHMIPLSKERIIELWKRLVRADIEGLFLEPWKPGYTV